MERLGSSVKRFLSDRFREGLLQNRLTKDAGAKGQRKTFCPAFVCTSCYSVEIARHLDAAKLTLTPRSASNVDDPAVFGVNPKFCVNAKLWCKIEQKYFKAGAAQAAAAFSTKITALRGDVKGGGVSLRSSRLLTFRLQPVSPACGRQRTPPTVCELRSSPAAFRSTSS